MQTTHTSDRLPSWWVSWMTCHGSLLRKRKKEEPRHSLLQLLLDPIVSFVLCANLLASVIQPNHLGLDARDQLPFHSREKGIFPAGINCARETLLGTSHHPPPSRSWRGSRLSPSGTLESKPTLCSFFNKVEVRLLSWWQLMRTLKSPLKLAYQKTSAED